MNMRSHIYVHLMFCPHPDKQTIKLSYKNAPAKKPAQGYLFLCKFLTHGDMRIIKSNPPPQSGGVF